MVPTRFTPAAFLLALVCFALPFAKISCQGQEVATLTGIETLTGKTVQGPGDSQKIPSDAMAIAAFIAALAGAALAFKGMRRFAGFAGIAGVVLLFVFKSRFADKIASESQGAAVVEFGLGFWLALIGLAAGAVLGLMPDTASTPAAPAPQNTPPAS
ncbi:MAG: hypothetical protein EPO35_01660 [Acidobacteria bacterium]|nr:MAG: hypothetical protein EPO35_01660 [Acidobacteriota bacterium]